MGDRLPCQSLLTGLTVPIIFTTLGLSNKMISFESLFKVSDLKGGNRKWMNNTFKRYQLRIFSNFYAAPQNF